MFPSPILRQAAAHAERVPMIKFIGRRSIPAALDHSPQPHPASPSGKLPAGFTGYGDGSSNPNSKHNSFSSYRDHAQQFGPLQKTIRNPEAGIGGSSASQLGSVTPTKGIHFDRNDLPSRFRRAPLSAAEIEAVESGGAALFG